jgi:hypothetical protein
LGWVIVQHSTAEEQVTFLQQFYIGAGLELTQSAQGIRIGAGRFTVLRVDPSESGTYLLKYTSRDPAAGGLVRISDEGGS